MLGGGELLATESEFFRVKMLLGGGVKKGLDIQSDMVTETSTNPTQ